MPGYSRLKMFSGQKLDEFKVKIKVMLKSCDLKLAGHMTHTVKVKG